MFIHDGHVSGFSFHRCTKDANTKEEGPSPSERRNGSEVWPPLGVPPFAPPFVSPPSCLAHDA